jgi:hypothetical protein
MKYATMPLPGAGNGVDWVTWGLERKLSGGKAIHKYKSC